MTKREFMDNFTAELTQVDWGRTALLVLLVVAIVAALAPYIMPPMVHNATTFHRAPGIAAAANVPSVYLACPEAGIQVLDKAALGKRMDLSWIPGGNLAQARPAGPATIAGMLQATPGEAVPPSTGLTVNQDGEIIRRDGEQPVPGIEITSTVDVAETRNGAEVVNTIDMATGISTPYVREKSSPWFQFRNDGAIGVKYGLNQRLLNAGEVYARWDFLRMKDLYLSANGDLSTGGDARILLGAEYRWSGGW